MKDPLIHFPFYCNQYLGMLQKYTYEQQGAFIRVLAMYIAEDGYVTCKTAQERYRFFAAYTDSEQAAVDHVFNEAVALAKEIINHQKEIRKRRRDAGRKGGKISRKNNKHSLSNAKILLKHTETETETETETDEQLTP